MKSFLVILSFFVLVFTSSYAQGVDVKKLDRLFDVLQNRGLATGSVAVAVNGKMVYQRAIGFVMVDENKKITADQNSKYRIGSVSKLFTAVLIFQLIDEKKLSLDTKLVRYFPQLTNADKISIKEMLSHRSGLHDYTRDTNFPDWMSEPKTHPEMLEIIARKAADFRPNSKAEYSNTNYLLLSYIIEKITHQTYAEALSQRITSKLVLKNTYYAKPIAIERNEAASFKYADSSWHRQKESDASIHAGAGSVVSTPTDLTLFIQHLFSGKLISRSSLDNMMTINDGYGMGLFPYDFDKTKGYGHNGRIEEFYSAVRYYPEKNLAVSYVTNGILFPRTDILNGVLKVCFGNAYTLPFSTVGVTHRFELDKYAGTYSSGDLPFKVVCKRKGEKLIVEAGGKTMEAEPVSATYFMNLKTGSFFEFIPAKGQLQIKETDNVYNLQKEKKRPIAVGWQKMR